MPRRFVIKHVTSYVREFVLLLFRRRSSRPGDERYARWTDDCRMLRFVVDAGRVRREIQTESNSKPNDF